MRSTPILALIALSACTGPSTATTGAHQQRQNTTHTRPEPSKPSTHTTLPKAQNAPKPPTKDATCPPLAVHNVDLHQAANFIAKTCNANVFTVGRAQRPDTHTEQPQTPRISYRDAGFATPQDRFKDFAKTVGVRHTTYKPNTPEAIHILTPTPDMMNLIDWSKAPEDPAQRFEFMQRGPTTNLSPIQLNFTPLSQLPNKRINIQLVTVDAQQLLVLLSKEGAFNTSAKLSGQASMYLRRTPIRDVTSVFLSLFNTSPTFNPSNSTLTIPNPQPLPPHEILPFSSSTCATEPHRFGETCTALSAFTPAARTFHTPSPRILLLSYQHHTIARDLRAKDPFHTQYHAWTLQPFSSTDTHLRFTSTGWQRNEPHTHTMPIPKELQTPNTTPTQKNTGL